MTHSPSSTLADDIKQLQDALATATHADTLKIDYLSKNGHLKRLFEALKTADAEQRPTLGLAINALREATNARLAALETAAGPAIATKQSDVDIFRQPYTLPRGTLHPIDLMISEISEIFSGIGFDIIDDCEIESEENCFDKLRIPAWHPARDTQDTFFIKGAPHTLLRTHSTATQPKILASRTPPFKIISIGKVFRSDEIDATHTPMFHQVDGFMVGKDLNLAHLKGVLEVFIREFLPQVKELRFRPHYFSYTEPSLELDVNCYMCQGAGCKACKHQGWIELLGAGMMHPELFTMAGYPADTYQGFAFGLGLERLVMQRYGIDDIRDLYNNDLKLLSQITG